MEIQDISDCLSLEAQNLAEARLAAKRAARAEAREIRMKELERQQKEVEERPEKDFAEKDSLAEVEEKYKRSMVTNAQLDNEKTSLVYQVDTLREVLLELEEELAESRRQYDEKHKECERQKHEQNVLRFQLTELKDALQQREEMLTALERQKEFFDPVRSERDELREEVARLKEELKKRGVALDSRDTHNGDSSLEPHINDACLDPPLQGTSLGKTQEADEKKEEITVACQVPRSETEQDRNEVQANAPEEVSVHAESRGSKEEPINIETASGSVLETVFSDNCTVDGLQTSSNRHQDAPDSKDISREDAEENNDVEVQDIGNVLILDPCVTEVNGDSAQNPRDTSPTGSEDFEDALDFVAQNTDPARFQEASSFSLNVYNNNAEGQIRQQEGIPVESRKCTMDNLPCDDHVVQEKEDSTLESKPVDSAAQKDKEDDAQSDDANNLQAKEFQENCKESSKCDGETGEENVAEVVSPCDELMVNQELTERCENKSKDDSEGVQSEHSPNEDITKLNEITVLVDQKNKDEPLPSLESGEGDKDLSMAVHTVPSAVSDIWLDQDKSLTIEQSTRQTSLRGENVAVDQYGAEQDVEHVVKCTESLGGGDENITPDATLATDLGCEKKIQINEISETTDLEEQEGKTKTSSEDLVPEDDNGKKRINSTQSTEENRSETAQSESLSSEGENTQDDDDDSDTNEDHSVPTEKYPGEREMPRTHIGSSVDRASSSEDVRVEESEGKNVKRGKGKNKEDCSLS